MAMTTSRLRLFQLVSPALPVGASSYAEGVEGLVQAGRLAAGPAVARWLDAELRRGVLVAPVPVSSAAGSARS